MSGQEKNFTPATRTYDTRWTDFGTSCERCHGPGRAPRASRGAGAPLHRAADARSAPQRETAVCAQCHSLRDVVAPGFAAGADYDDHFMPILEYAQKTGADPAYWADGRPRRFSNDALGLWQSDCFVKGGATCLTCHDPHAPDVDTHPQLAASQQRPVRGLPSGAWPRRWPRTRATRPGSAGSSCVECHMPKTVVSIKATIRDHAIGPPVPEATVRFGIPNACNACHADRSAAWARDTVRRWKADRSGARLLARAEAFTGGRKGEAAALPRLVAWRPTRGEPPLVRANAVGHLRRYRDAAALEALAARSLRSLAGRARGGGPDALHVAFPVRARPPPACARRSATRARTCASRPPSP